MSTSQPSMFSFPFALHAGEGHFTAGQRLYEEFENMVRRPRADGEHVDMFEAVRIGAPAVLNMALALEILIKAHHFQTTEVYPKGHDVAKLALALPSDSLAQIRDQYLEVVSKGKIPQGMSFRLRINESEVDRDTVPEPEYDFSTFDAAVAYVGDIYRWWRYFYEELADQANIFISFAPIYRSAIAVHRVVMDFLGNTKISMNPRSES